MPLLKLSKPKAAGIILGYCTNVRSLLYNVRYDFYISLFSRDYQEEDEGDTVTDPLSSRSNQGQSSPERLYRPTADYSASPPVQASGKTTTLNQKVPVRQPADIKRNANKKGKDTLPPSAMPEPSSDKNNNNGKPKSIRSKLCIIS